eukprot:scaffold5247_cov132-Skeletonema_dohrnii-CCMP3373.AAC.6
MLQRHGAKFRTSEPSCFGFLISYPIAFIGRLEGDNTRSAEGLMVLLPAPALTKYLLKFLLNGCLIVNVDIVQFGLSAGFGRVMRKVV